MTGGAAQRAAAIYRLRRRASTAPSDRPGITLFAVAIHNTNGQVVEVVSPFWGEKAAQAWVQDTEGVDPDRCLLVPTRLPTNILDRLR